MDTSDQQTSFFFKETPKVKYIHLTHYNITNNR